MRWVKDLESESFEDWEKSFIVVDYGLVTIDHWLLYWLWFRIKWSNAPYSLFKSGTVLIDASILRTRVLVETGNCSKKRNIYVRFFRDNPYQAAFEAGAEVSTLEQRCPSFGNPFLDKANYEFWERMLFCKLFHQVLEEKNGLSFFIESIRSY